MKILISFLVASLLLVSGNASAWYFAGHKLVAMIAYAQLSEEAREKLIYDLMKHPMYEDEFIPKIGKDLTGEVSDEQFNNWLCAQSAIWPDLAREYEGKKLSQYHHGTWHYINIPIFLDEQDELFFGEDLPGNTALGLSEDMSLEQMNVSQAYKHISAALANPKTSKADRAIYWCWMFHLVGDIHQPLHAAALYSEEKFPKGDQGGNLLAFNGGNFHWYWDGLPASEELAFGDMLVSVDEMYKDMEQMAVGEFSLSEMDFDKWIMESFELAVSQVYAPVILEATRKTDANEDKITIALSEESFSAYDEVARALAKKRVVEAGFRLARVIENIYAEQER